MTVILRQKKKFQFSNLRFGLMRRVKLGLILVSRVDLNSINTLAVAA